MAKGLIKLTAVFEGDDGERERVIFERGRSPDGWARAILYADDGAAFMMAQCPPEGWDSYIKAQEGYVETPPDEGAAQGTSRHPAIRELIAHLWEGM